MPRCLIALTVLTVGSALAGQQLPTERLLQILDLARLSEAAYHRDPLQPFGDPKYGLWQLRSRVAEDSGLNLDLFERRDAQGRTEWVVAFAGTEITDRRFALDGKDLATDFSQAFGSSPQYADGLRAAERLVAQAREQGIAITFTGHSLGGGLAQAASLRTGAPATVFDSAPLGPEYRRAPSPELQRLADTNVTNIRLREDPISLLPGDQLGQLYTVEMAPSVRTRMPNPLGGALVVVGRLAVAHGMQHLITSLEYLHAERANVAPARAVPGVWSRGFGGNAQLESTAMAAQAAGAKSVLIYGSGRDADLMADLMARRLGRDHVHRQPEGVGVHDIQRRARDLGVDHVIGFRESWPQTSVPQQRTMLSREVVKNFVSTSLSIGSAMNELAAYRYGKSALNDTIADRLEIAGYIHDAYELARAFENDMRSARQGDFAFVRSELLHEVFGKLAELAESRAIERAFGAKLTFGFADLARGHARQAATGQLDWQAATHYLDGVNKAAWSGLGAAVSGGNPHAITAFGTLGEVAASTLRDASYEAIRGLHSTLSGTDDALLAAWRLDQQNRVRGNFELQTFSHYLHANGLPTAGLPAGHVAQIDRVETETYRRQQATLHTTPPAALGARERQQQQAVPGFWTSYRPHRDEPGHLLESRILVQMARDTKRAVVVGYGPEADRIHQRLAARLGPENVVREQTNPSPSVLQRVAAEFGASAIFGARPEVTTRIRTHSHYRVVQKPDPGQERRVTPPPGLASVTAWQPVNPTRPQPHFTPTASHGVGGVMLDAAAKVENGADAVAQGRFSLMFENSHAGIDLRELRRFVTALWAVYFSKEGPGVSIDPIAPDLDQHLVRYIGNVINTDLARVMREADYMMKKWAVGTERPELPGFENPDDIAFRLGRLCAEGTSRFWFVPDDMRFRATGASILFQSGRVVLRTETLGRGGHIDQSNEEFAARFTASYPEIAARHPIYAELFTYAKLIGLARYLKDNRVPMLWYLLANKDLILTEDSPGTVSELVKPSEHHPRVTIKGGVDLAVPRSSTHYVMDAAAVSALQRALDTRTGGGRRPVAGASPVVTVSNDSMAVTVTGPEALSLACSAVGGDVYQTDLALRRQGEPGLEIIRHHAPDYEGPATFGDEWHLLIPYRLRPADARRRAHGNVRVPEAITVHNLLTGATEDLVFDANKYDCVGYVPADVRESTVLGAFFLTDGSLRLVDKLGSQFHFDPTGELVAMLLTDDYTIELEYGERLRPATAAEQPALRLQARRGGHASIGGMELPTDLELRTDEDAIACRFRLVRDDPDGRVRYEAMGQQLPYSHATALTDGGVMVHEKRGRLLVFDARGVLRHVGARIVTEMKQGTGSVAFTYEFAGFDCRIVRADVRAAGGTAPLHAVSYLYAEGRLAEVRAAGRVIRIDYSSGRIASAITPQ